MKKYFFCTFITLCLAGWTMPCAAQVEDDFPIDSTAVDSAITDSAATDPSLNDIRFANFEEKDWLDNDYIRTLRKDINIVLEGKVEDPEMDPYKQMIPYKDNMKGKFVIADLEPFMFGGLIIQIIFIDQPENVFTAWVYSNVDEESQTVYDYEVRMFLLEETKSELTKDQILELIKEHPELKLW